MHATDKHGADSARILGSREHAVNSGSLEARTQQTSGRVSVYRGRESLCLRESCKECTSKSNSFAPCQFCTKGTLDTNVVLAPKN